MFLVNSSNIYAVGYQQEKEQLYVEFLDGSIYRYNDVPESIWKKFLIVESKGSFLHFYVKINDNVYDYEDVTGEVDVTYTGYAPNPGTPHESGYMV